jgi:hypothetical protein
MKKLSLFNVVCILTQIAFAQTSKWQILFDGSSTANWHIYNNPGKPTAWSIQEGALYLDASSKEGRGDLITNEEYEAFELHFEWKVSTGNNGGVIFFVQEDPKFGATFITGPEFQVIDNVGYPGKLDDKQKAASLYDLIPCDPSLIKPAGEWNKSVIRFKDKKLEFIVNGTKAIRTTLWDENWEKMVSGSKFAKMCCFAKTAKGRIALQDHGGGTWYRNIKIRRL